VVYYAFIDATEMKTEPIN